MNIIERAARAIADECERQVEQSKGTGYFDGGDLREAVMDGYFDLSKVVAAVLTAVREPTDAMAKAAGLKDAEQDFGNAPWPEHWEAMIDAALGDLP
jgi:hypothetical protein